jgi:putative ABC transport system substrate-binding protein
LQELGWVDGRNVQILYVSESHQRRFSQIAQEFAQAGVDVMVATGSSATRAAIGATRTIPIVFGSAANPVENKFVASLGRPGGNVTGLALLVQELGPKRLQLLKETLPKATRFARLYEEGFTSKEGEAAIVREDDAAARKLGVSVEHIAISGRGADNEVADRLERAFSDVKRAGVQALYVKADALFVVRRKTIADLALRERLPMMCADARFCDAGALLSYGENFPERYRQAASVVHRILQGARPADIPVDQPMTLELVVNLQTARRLGITVPQSVLEQTDRRIE